MSCNLVIKKVTIIRTQVEGTYHSFKKASPPVAVQFPPVLWILPANAAGSVAERTIPRISRVSVDLSCSRTIERSNWVLTVTGRVSRPVSMQEVQAGDTTSFWRLWTGLYAKGTNRIGIPGGQVPPFLEEVEFLGGEFIRDYEETLSPGAQPRVGRGSGKESWFSSSRGGARIANI